MIFLEITKIVRQNTLTYFQHLNATLLHEIVGTQFAEGKLGEVESEIYKRLSVRVKIEELFDDKNNRVLVFNIPSRNLGDPLTFEGVD